MKLFVFTGPTLPAEQARTELEAIYLPPVSQGDVYRVSLERPAAIAIIDGYFECVPSVWHKEILWAMAQGIHVLGGASMGALRAAELAPLGMKGVGAVYEAFARGQLEDDDEVAVIHGPAEEGYRVLSEAMVNIRATLEEAATAGVIAGTTHLSLERLAKELFYAERSYPLLLEKARQAGLPLAELEALKAFLPKGRVDRKRLDALELLRELREQFSTDVEPKQVRYRFQHTDAWEQLRRTAEREPLESSGGEGPARASAEDALPHDALVEELQLTGRYPDVLREALARALAREIARLYNKTFEGQALEVAAEALRRELGLLTRDALEQWFQEQDVRDPRRLLQDEARVRWAEAMFGPDARMLLPDQLRVLGAYGQSAARARDKRRLLASRGMMTPSLAGLGLSEEALFRWYFAEQLHQELPADLQEKARSMGFPDVDALRRAVLREHLYVHREGARPPDETAREPQRVGAASRSRCDFILEEDQTWPVM
jgi:hypothetical protein